jgi:hypothetical protein
MSIFASYYGIEETAAPQMKGTIDDANFDSETFVRVRVLSRSLSVAAAPPLL